VPPRASVRFTRVDRSPRCLSAAVPVSLSLTTQHRAAIGILRALLPLMLPSKHGAVWVCRPLSPVPRRIGDLTHNGRPGEGHRLLTVWCSMPRHRWSSLKLVKKLVLQIIAWPRKQLHVCRLNIELNNLILT